MQTRFSEKWWTMTIEDGEVKEPPVPNGCKFAITQIEALGTTSERVLVQMICSTVRLDKVKDDEETVHNMADIADVSKINIASIFPRVKSDYRANIYFSQFNETMFGAIGGSVTISGVYNNDEPSPIAQENDEE